MRRRNLFICFRLPNGQPRRTNMAALIACRDYLEEKLLVQQRVPGSQSSQHFSQSESMSQLIFQEDNPRDACHVFHTG